MIYQFQSISVSDLEFDLNSYFDAGHMRNGPLGLDTLDVGFVLIVRQYKG